MAFSRSSIRGATGSIGGAGAVDYRLRRHGVIDEYRKGRLAEHEVCDAHPELVRAAQDTDYNPAIALLSQSIQRNGTPLANERVYVQLENTNDLVRQIEALLISHEDQKRGRGRKAPARIAKTENHNSRARRAR